MSMEHQNAPHQWNEETIDLSEIYFLFRQRIKWIVVALVAGAVAAAIITLFFITPLYRATASLYVVSASNDSVVDLSDLQIGASLTADYEILLLSRPMMESVIQNLALEDATVESLSKQITISNPSDTRILQITVEDKDPELAAQIANEMANLGITWLPAVMDSSAPNVAEDAVAPIDPSSPSMIKNILIGALAAAVLYCGVVLVTYLMNDTIRTSDELERYFGLVPLAVVPECGQEQTTSTSRPGIPSFGSGKPNRKKGA